MKNRTIIGIVCAVLALVIMFVVAPLFNRIASNDIQVVRLKQSVARGVQITNAHLETVSVPGYAIPAGALKTPNEIVGKYSTSQLYAGDYLTAGKLSDVSIAADDVLANMEDGKVAISVPLGSFSGHLSGKLQNGDIVRFYVNDQYGKPSVPGALQYVKIVTTTTGSGIDKDQIVENEDGSFSMPSTVTVVVNDIQAKLLVDYASNNSMYLALIYRGDEETTQKYLDMQEEYFKTHNDYEQEAN